jgi:hypothetical protein
MLGKKLKAKTTNLAKGGATMATVTDTNNVENSIPSSYRIANRSNCFYIFNV